MLFSIAPAYSYLPGDVIDFNGDRECLCQIHKDSLRNNGCIYLFLCMASRAHRDDPCIVKQCIRVGKQKELSVLLNTAMESDMEDLQQ